MKTPVRRRKSEAGQATVLLILALGIFLLGALGLAIDGSQMYAQRQMAQAAADAAATSGILSIYHGTNSTSSYPFATGTPPSSFTCTTSDGRTPCVYAQRNGFGTTSADTVSVTFPTSVSGVTLATSSNAPAISVSVKRTLNTTLIRFLGPSTTSVTATATAAMVKAPLANCITSLDPSGSGALSVTGNADLDLSGCGIAVDSSSSSAFSVTGNITLTASKIQVVGGYSHSGNISVSPTPTTGASAVSDPFASVPEPSPASCSQTNYSLSGNQTVTLQPGTYCGGITLTGNVNVTFATGTYILLGGGLNASGNVSLTSASGGVTFYNTFNGTYPYAPISLTGNITANLTALTTGPTAGILFFQNRNAPSGYTESLVGNSNVTLVGAAYFPKSTLSLVGNASASSPDNLAIVAYDIQITGNASLQYNPNQAGAAEQLAVALVQ